jgi:hypothetical protein
LFAIERVGLILWVLALLGIPWGRAVMLRIGLVLAIGIEVITPLIWNLGFPPTDGIEQAGRWILGVPLVAANAFLSIAWAALLGPRVGRGRWEAARAFFVAGLGGVLAAIFVVGRQSR